MNPIAYLVLCHNDPEQLRRLVLALNIDADFFVHVDQKVNLEPFASQPLPSNVHFCHDRARVYWGGYSIVDATLRLMRQAMACGTYDRVVLLNGLDYPIKPTSEINRVLIEVGSKNREFIRFFDIKSCGAEFYLDKARGIYFYDAPRWLVNRFYDGRQFLTKSLRRVKRPLPPRLVHCFGHMQWAITGACCQYILRFVAENPRFCQFYRYSFAPDEHFFHTVVANSPFCDSAGGVEPFVEFGTARMANLHHIDASLNKVYKESDFDELARSSKLFTKKLTTNDSGKLLEMIDSRLRQEQ
jgi:hypothetical protein